MTPEARARQVLRQTGAQCPIDIDTIANRYSDGIEIDDLPASRPAIRIGRGVYLDRRLTRDQQRLHGAHELHHIIENTPDQIERIERYDPTIEIEEAEADEFALRLLMPEHVVAEAVMSSWTVEECVCAFGLPAPVILKRIELWRAEKKKAWWH